MRLISLVDLGSDESGRVPYSLIRDTLQVSLDYVFLGLLLSFRILLIIVMHASDRSVKMKWNLGWLRL